MLVPPPSILFIDAYDSFTNNIISLLSTTLSCSVRVIHIDSPGFETDEALQSELRYYDAVVCGPGPGDPSNSKDVGLMNRIWRLADDHMVPTLGICLGFQSLCLAFGGEIKVLPEGLHGIVKRIHYMGEYQKTDNQEVPSELFNGVGEVWATLYHSLYINIGQDAMSKTQWREKLWNAFPTSVELQPLAWVSPVEKEDLEQTGTKNGPILTGVMHKTKPFYGLQYHPESICTNKESETIIRNWFDAAQRWNKEHVRYPHRDQSDIRGELPTRPSLLSSSQLRKNEKIKLSNKIQTSSRLASKYKIFDSNRVNDYDSYTIDLPSHISVPDIVQMVAGGSKDNVLLESSNCHIRGKGAEDVRGRYSIIGLEVDKALRIQYQVGDNCVVAYQAPCYPATEPLSEVISLEEYGGIWEFVAAFLEGRSLDAANNKSPFLGGFIGYTTYELGLEGINVERDANSRHVRPDLCFAFITRSLVIDHMKNQIYIQELVDKSSQGWDRWLLDYPYVLKARLKKVNALNISRSGAMGNDCRKFPVVIKQSSAILPSNSIYEAKVLACQRSITAGDSYELCLTDQTHITLPQPILRSTDALLPMTSDQSQISPWVLYKTLRARQPAPFASFIRLGSATFISASPERFLTWSPSGLCSLRPMKGTVRKTATINTVAQATALLQVPKERAENLMIVDLVRHDLHGVCGPGNVSVPRLMVVEEYASVFQMISIVEGQIPQSTIGNNNVTMREPDNSRRMRHSGIDVLAASLPPGSMTGAPKKRSCELLHEIEEHKDRGLYSGVVGYMCVSGGGDFSVNIRCMFRWDDEAVKDPEGDGEAEIETWHIGAGGAVTALSTPVAEREEMQTKLAGTLGVFGL